ncbi:hypothetical protein BDQ12DRAFT_675940 [Crucibulum laeve]|uniref:Guanine deaminase n=1 Tax=Crucibulum laeve TaxID=68775 RepID=A0A5C3MC19_9AGAR|nr:hypothetical protein BDQ12DRAFT_675940 [Crucibulum laeve]
MSGTTTIFYGPVINPKSLDAYAALPRCLLCVGPTGNVEWLVEDVKAHLLQETLAQKGCIDEDVVELKMGEFIIPGFIDTHTHAPQVPNIGSGQQYELLDWLDKVTFPMEAKFANTEFAQRTYQNVVRRIIDCGTTTCCYYGSLHLPSTKILANIVHTLGQRAFVGKCNMNRNCPSDYIEDSASSSLTDTSALIKHIHELPSAPTVHAATGTQHEPLVQPIITPRFAISCTGELLSGLGELAAQDPHLRIQTHISENHDEIKFTKELFPECESYADVYDTHGLLRGNTVLAHAVHLEESECKLIKKRDAGISHCPTSNFNLRSGVAPVGKFLDLGIKVGLGTDISGGFSPSILTAIQHASIASKIVAMQSPPSSKPPPPGKYASRQLPLPTLLYLATLGGARVCALESRVGSFEEGKAFDALLVNVRSEAGNIGLWGADLQDIDGGKEGKEKEVLDGLLERFFFTGDDRNISRVYVQGRLVGGKSFRGRVD